MIEAMWTLYLPRVALLMCCALAAVSTLLAPVRADSRVGAAPTFTPAAAQNQAEILQLTDGSIHVGVVEQELADQTLVVRLATQEVLRVNRREIKRTRLIPTEATARAAELVRVVALKNKALLCGELISLVPNDYIILRLGHGKVQRLAFSEIEALHGNVSEVTLPSGQRIPRRMRLVLVTGSLVSGDFVQFVPEDKLTLALSTGEALTLSLADVRSIRDAASAPSPTQQPGYRATPGVPPPPPAPSNPWFSTMNSRALESYLEESNVKLLIFPVGISQPPVQQAAEAILEALAQSPKVREARLASPVQALDSELIQAARLEKADNVLVVRASSADPSIVVVKIFSRLGTLIGGFRAKPSVPISERSDPAAAQAAATDSLSPGTTTSSQPASQRLKPDPVRVSIHSIGMPLGNVRLLRHAGRSYYEYESCATDSDGVNTCGDVQVRLESWKELCVGSCGIETNRDDKLMLAVRDIGEIGPFSFRNVAGPQATVVIRLTPWKRKFVISGLVLTVAGGLTSLVGTALGLNKDVGGSIASLALGVPSLGVGIGLLVAARNKLSLLVLEANPRIPDLPPE